jgi:cysteine synthase A
MFHIIFLGGRQLYNQGEKDFGCIAQMIGQTPLLEIKFRFQGKEHKIYAKDERYNFTGSIKDRMALHILYKAYQNGALKSGCTIIEATSGNTGISFAAIGRALGYETTIFMPDWMSSERINLIKSYGAEIFLVGRDEGGFLGCIKMADAKADELELFFLPHQFSNQDNCEAHYLSTGPEIWQDFQKHNMIPDAVVAGVGTGGTIMGVGTYLKGKNPNLMIHPLEPSSSPIISTGSQTGHHRIQGISDELIPPILNLDIMDQVITVDDGDAIIMAQKLARDLGLGVGISSGANFLGALKAQSLLGGNGSVVTILVDDNKKYLSTDLMKDEPMEDNYLSSQVELLEFRRL